MKTSLEDKLTREAIAHQLADSDLEWWPFAFLRPETHQRLSSLRCALLSVLYGLPAALLGIVAGSLAGDEVDSKQLFLLPLCVCAITFALMRFGFAVFWNRRASRHRSLHERRRNWQQSLEDD